MCFLQAQESRVQVDQALQNQPAGLGQPCYVPADNLQIPSSHMLATGDTRSRGRCSKLLGGAARPALPVGGSRGCGSHLICWRILGGGGSRGSGNSALGAGVGACYWAGRGGSGGILLGGGSCQLSSSCGIIFWDSAVMEGGVCGGL